MMVWRYWITYSGRISSKSEDETVVAIAAADVHAERIHGGDMSYVYELEVEPVDEGREGE